MKKGSIFPIISLIISIIAFVLYAMLLDNPSSSILRIWVLSSVISVFMPILSKFLRKKEGNKGKSIEIIALIIGCFNFYFVFFALTKISLYIVYIIIFAICFLYAKVFNNIETKEIGKDPLNPLVRCKSCGYEGHFGKKCPRCQNVGLIETITTEKTNNIATSAPSNQTQYMTSKKIQIIKEPSIKSTNYFQTKSKNTIKKLIIKPNYCHKCNESLPVDSVFCQYCGEKLENQSKKPKKIATRIIALTLSVVVLVSGGVLAYLYYATPYFDYIQAVKTFEQGNYSDAHTQFYLLNDYKDSKERMKECRNQEALQFLKNNDYNGFITFFNTYHSQIDIKIPKKYREGFYNAVLNRYKYSNFSLTSFSVTKQVELFELLPNNYKDINKIRKFYNILDNYDYDEYDSEREFLKEYMPDLKQLWHYKPVRDWLLSDAIIYDFMVGDWQCGSYYLTFYYNNDRVSCKWYAPVSFNNNYYDYYEIEDKVFKFTKKSNDDEYKLYKFSFSDKNTLTAYCYGNGQYYTFKR